MQLQYNIYTQVVQQLQIARAKVQEKTPVFTVLQTSFVPIKHCNKPKIITMIQFMLLGFIGRVCYIFYKRRKEIFGLEESTVAKDINITNGD